MSEPKGKVKTGRLGTIDHTIHGADLWQNRLGFFGKALLMLAAGSLATWAAGSAIGMLLLFSELERSQFFGLMFAKAAHVLRFGGIEISFPILKDGSVVEISRRAAVIAESMPRTWTDLSQRAMTIFSVALIPAALVAMKLWAVFGRTGTEMKTGEYLRGAKFVAPEELDRVVQETQSAFENKLVAAGKVPDPPVMTLTVGPVRLPKDREVQGFYISGSTGSGKTVAQKSIMRQVRDANQKMIVYDPAPEFVREFFRPGDVILNPLDARGVFWEPWSEIRKAYDYKSFAESLIEMDPKYASFAQAAQTVLAAFLEKTRSIRELLDASRKNLNDLEVFLTGTPAQGVISAANSRGSDTVMGMIRQKLAVFNYMLPPYYAPPPGGQSFSIRDWVRDDEDRRWIFLVCPEDQRPLLRPLITLWFDIVAREIMTLAPNNDLPIEKRRRIWLMLEELPSLPAIPSLEGLTAKGRKYGAVWVITVQDPGQLNAIYSQEITKAILQNCNTWLIFRANNAETAKLVSAQIGQYEEMEKVVSLSFGLENERDGSSYSAKRALRDAVLPSEIQRLDDLNCFLILYGNYPATKVSIPFVSFAEIQPGSVMRPDLVAGHAVATGEPVLERNPDPPTSAPTSDDFAVDSVIDFAPAPEVDRSAPNVKPKRDGDVVKMLDF